MKELYTLQKEYFLTGKTLPVSFRKEALKKLYHAIDRYEDDIVSALYLDLGKSREESYMSEIGMVKGEITHMLKHLNRYCARHYVSSPVSQFLSFSYRKAVPYGTTLILSPWNYPFLLTFDPLVSAIAAGNTAVVKPGPASVHTDKVMEKIITETFDPEYVSLVQGDKETADALLELPFDFVFFTGGTTAGKHVYEKCAEKLVPCVLELGGKSPCIVDESADIELSAKRIVFGKFLNCGQTCVAPDYVIVHSSVKEQLIQALIKEIKKQYGDDPLHSEKYGKIIHEGHFERLIGLIKKDSVVYGGKYDQNRLRIEPTVLDDVSYEDAIMQEEIFGPLLPVMTYESFDSLVNELKRMPHPLALYLFTKNKEHIKTVDEQLRYGGGCINDTIIHLASTSLGFGGTGESGIGMYHGKDGFEAFSHTKSVVDKKCLIDLPMRYAPYKNKIYEKLIRMFLK